MLRLGNPHSFVDLANRVSMGKGQDIYGVEKDINWWKDALLSEHSSLEFSDFFWMEHLDGRAISHLVRHTKGHPRHVVQSQREDWTGKERPPAETKRWYVSKWTPYAWIEMCKQRLCRKTAEYTREAVMTAREEMLKSGVPFFKGIAWASVPMCVYRGGCPYKKSCGFYSHRGRFQESIKERYDTFTDLQRLYP